MTTPIISTLHIEKIREQFPVLNQKVNGQPLIYLDNAATSQKPVKVIDALVDYYKGYNANIHRGIHSLAEKATKEYEETRLASKVFINAPSEQEVIFVRGVTEAINLVASSYGRPFVKAGDEVIISAMEHHSNIVPWQMLCEEMRARLRIIPVYENGEIDLDAFQKLLSSRTRIVSVCHASNSLGTINPVKEIVQLAHTAGAMAMIDGAQAGAHIPIDVQDIDCDFYCLSAHKMYGPTGAGILFGKKQLLEQMPPYQGGGEMIKEVTFEKTTYNDLPYKFEAGTPNIADVIAFKSAMDFINRLGKDHIEAHEHELLTYATQKVAALKGSRIIGTASNKVSVLSFLIDGIHPFDIGQMLDAKGIAVRTGHHCTQPLMDQFGIEGTVRASFAVYNTRQEIDKLVESLERIIRFMKP